MANRALSYSVLSFAVLIIVVFTVGTLRPTDLASRTPTPSDAVVRITATVAPVDVYEPWKREGASDVQGSGIILPDGHILTNAHVVQDAMVVRVKQEGTTRSFDAEVLFVQPQVDLALLRVTDPSFNKARHGLELGDWPDPQTPVQALGYPEGGQSLSVTTGVVSRVELGLVLQSFEDHFLLQTDAAINAGNSGGPLVAEGRCVGLNTQAVGDAENIAYAIPAPVIRQFLHDVADGRVDGVPSLGASFGGVDNPAELRWLKVPEEAEGVVVMAVVEDSGAATALRRGDFLTHINGKPIGRDFTIEGPNGQRFELDLEVQLGQVGGEVSIEWLRDGERHTATVGLSRTSPLMASRGSDERREYLVYGGAQFQPLTVDFALLFEDGAMPANLAMRWEDDVPRTRAQRQLVVLSRVLTHPLNRGYDGMSDLAVATVDGVAPTDFRHFVALVTEGRDRYVRIRFETDEEMVFERAEVAGMNDEVLGAYGVGGDRWVVGGDGAQAR